MSYERIKLYVTAKEENKEHVAHGLLKVLASNFVLYFKFHSAHWNVMGENFVQYHKFLDEFYNQLWGNVDPIAEHIRACGYFAPNSMKDLLEKSTIHEFKETVKDANEMFSILHKDNTVLIGLMKSANKTAEEAGEAGVSNFLADLIDKHEKLNWQLKSITKEKSEEKKEEK